MKSKMVTLSVRLTETEHNRLKAAIAKRAIGQPPTNGTALMRWLLLTWIHEVECNRD